MSRFIQSLFGRISRALIGQRLAVVSPSRLLVPLWRRTRNVPRSLHTLNVLLLLLASRPLLGLVSWQITGIRSDNCATQNPIQLSAPMPTRPIAQAQSGP